MTQARKLKSKLRSYSATGLNNDKQNSTSQKKSNTDTVSSVTDKISRLRLEQSRAEANRRRQQQQQQQSPSSSSSSSSSSLPHVIRSEPIITSGHIPPWNVIENRQEVEATADILIASRRFLAGPSPPRSWIRSRIRHELTNINNNNIPKDTLLQQRKQRLKLYYSQFSSLVELCAKQLYYLYDHHATAYYKKQFKSLPIHTKQMILYEWSFLGGLTTAQLDLFSKTEYEELWLEASKITIEQLIKTFWQAIEINSTASPLFPSSSLKNSSYVTDNEEDDIVDDWEQLADSDESNHDSVDIPSFHIHLDRPDTSDQYLHLNQIMQLLRPDLHIYLSTHYNPRHEKKNKKISPTHSISSPLLGQTLVSLNISFIELSATTKTAGSSSTLSWVSFAHLITTTLPNLLWFYSAGCFDEIHGPKAVSVLSHGLRKLRFWDLGYHPWLLNMNSLTSLIDWHHDLKELKTLCLTPPPNITATNGAANNNTDHQILADLSRWFHMNGLSRIRIIWDNL
ncbi:hypothetical protein BJ944DRAFT_260766 [Cunninghamella echinulata]|nr:hypothetical protein BJ944DRAFT_260766 [Cunninghamella echinulata]